VDINKSLLIFCDLNNRIVLTQSNNCTFSDKEEIKIIFKEKSEELVFKLRSTDPFAVSALKSHGRNVTLFKILPLNIPKILGDT